MAAGLAGGSADAAAVLHGLNQMSNEELMKLGEEIGSDVPFCLTGGTCLVSGRGEKIKKLDGQPPASYILVVPELEVSSKWAYDAWDNKSETLNPKQIRNSNSQNDLESVVIAKFPIIQEIKDQLVALGCECTQMSGSGPSVFGKCSDGEKILSAIKKKYSQSFLVKSV